MEEFNNRLDEIEEKISKIRDKTLEFIKSVEQKRKKK